MSRIMKGNMGTKGDPSNCHVYDHDEIPGCAVGVPCEPVVPLMKANLQKGGGELHGHIHEERISCADYPPCEPVLQEEKSSQPRMMKANLRTSVRSYQIEHSEVRSCREFPECEPVITAFSEGMRKRMLVMLEKIAIGFEYDPGHSDLDDEQPIHVQMTLGDYRRLRFLITEAKR